MDQMKIGAFLKELRKGKGLTQEQLGEKLGVSSRTVSRWETGSNMPDISLLIELADFYEVDIRELINGERNSEMMSEETRDVLTKAAEYTNQEKKRLLKDVMLNSVITFLCLILGNVGLYSGLSEERELFHALLIIGMTAPLCFALSTILDVLKISGNMGKSTEERMFHIIRIVGVIGCVICLAIILYAFFM